MYMYAVISTFQAVSIVFTTSKFGVLLIHSLKLTFINYCPITHPVLKTSEILFTVPGELESTVIFSPVHTYVCHLRNLKVTKTRIKIIYKK